MSKDRFVNSQYLPVDMGLSHRAEQYFIDHPIVLGRFMRGILNLPYLKVQGYREVFPEVIEHKKVGSIVSLIIGHQCDLDWPLDWQRILYGSLGFSAVDTKVIASVKHKTQEDIDRMGFGKTEDQSGIEGLSPLTVAASNGYEALEGFERVYVVQRYLMAMLNSEGRARAKTLNENTMKGAADFLADESGRSLGVFGEGTRNKSGGILRIQRGSTVPFLKAGSVACLPTVFIDSGKLQSTSHKGLLGLRPVNVINMKVGPLLTYDDLYKARLNYEWSEAALTADPTLGKFTLEDTLAMIALEDVQWPNRAGGPDPRGIYAYSNVIVKNK